MSSEKNRVAVVTGGTRGIGLGIARALVRDSWDVIVTGVRPAADVQPIVDELASHGTGVSYIASDISNRDERRMLIDAIRQRYGAVHALVNNAGRAPRVRADLLDATEESFEDLMRTNLQGPYFLTQALAADMIARREADASFDASIVFVTSVSAEMASVNRGEYCVSKAGLAMTVKLFASRLAAHGIPVYEARPGIVTTDMTAGVRDMYDRRIAEGLVPEKRWGRAEDIGRAVAALVRGDIPYATGTVLHLDGGMSVPRL